MKQQITFTWRDTSEIPDDFDKPILTVSKNEKLQTFSNTKTCHKTSDGYVHYSDFKRKVEKYGIVGWIYQEEIIQK